MKRLMNSVWEIFATRGKAAVLALLLVAVIPAWADDGWTPSAEALEVLKASLTISSTYYGAEIRGRIVDQETGKPIAGAVVVAHWMMSTTEFQVLPIFWAQRKDRLLYVTEALSGPDGCYDIPQWGPVTTPVGWAKEGPADPALAVFKPGYEPKIIHNWPENLESSLYTPYNKHTDSVLRSIHDGKDIALCKYEKCKRRILVYDSSVKETPEGRIYGRVESFASHLKQNVDLADEREAKHDSLLRLDAIRRQRHAILMVHEELQQLEKIDINTPAWRKSCFPWCDWSSDIRKFIESEHGKK